MNPLRILVTGTGKGLGRQLVNMIAKKNQDVEVIATVLQDIEGAQKQWNKLLGRNKITCYNLDITKQQSIKQLASSLKKNKLKFSAIVNNDGFGADYGPQIPSVEIATKTLRSNVQGTINFTNSVLDSLDQNGRIINICSRQGALKFQPKIARKMLEDAQITLQKLDSYIQQYIKGCDKKQLDHWFHASYGTSKAMIIAWSRFILHKQIKQGQSIICMSPGACFSLMQQQAQRPNYKQIQAIQGAQFIYNMLWIKPKPDVFYYTDYQTCYFFCG